MRVIRMFPDYGHQWPLWEDAAPTCTMSPADYGLSDELTAALRGWYDDWVANCSLDTGWRDSATQQAWIRAGRGLSRWLAREVASFADVSYGVGGGG